MATDLIPASKRQSALILKFADRYSLEPSRVMDVLKNTAFRVKGGEATNEQMAALLVVADQYGLNPFTREIYAFPDKQNGIVPVVGIDGWNRIANEHPQFAGEKIETPPREEWVTMNDGESKLCPPWVRVLVYRKDRDYPTDHTEYLDECYQPPRNGFVGPWQTHTKRMLEHKARIQARRIAFGFAGIYDPDEAERIVEQQAYDVEGEVVEETGEVITPAQVQAILEAIASKGRDPEAVLKSLHTSQVCSGGYETVPASQFDRVMQTITKLQPRSPKPAPVPQQAPALHQAGVEAVRETYLAETQVEVEATQEPYPGQPAAECPDEQDEAFLESTSVVPVSAKRKAVTARAKDLDEVTYGMLLAKHGVESITKATSEQCDALLADIERMQPRAGVA